ncbi:hypothetical protein [Paenibacillus gansuensis]|uniref:Uncharacterized protein n=1 Tax=Paenibacillus gansuensis TaxID=306542 RepID=A0ABW5PLG7_9BACL
MINKLLIKHVTGRMLLNTAAEELAFTHETAGEQWRFTVQGVPAETGKMICSYEDELNLFYMQENAEGQQFNKCWYYGKQTPEVIYDEAARLLSIQLDSRKFYTNERV